MAYMLFDNEEAYRNAIDEMLKKCDIFELDKFLNVMLRHFYPGCI